uniref:WD_REPEATS_REGION domain-containing protein n=1 Tax=Rhabditophanes sp. KR3021 TaxID=114890 RepID=A0AC35UI13_9BILA
MSSKIPFYVFYGIKGGPTALQEIELSIKEQLWFVGAGNGILHIFSTNRRKKIGQIVLDESIAPNCDLNPIQQIAYDKGENTDSFIVYILIRANGLYKINISFNATLTTDISFNSPPPIKFDVKSIGFAGFLKYDSNILVENCSGMALVSLTDGNILNYFSIPESDVVMSMCKVNKSLVALGTDGGFILIANVKNGKIIDKLSITKKPVVSVNMLNDKIIAISRNHTYSKLNFDGERLTMAEGNEHVYKSWKTPPKISIVEPSLKNFFIVALGSGKINLVKTENFDLLCEMNEHSNKNISAMAWGKLRKEKEDPYVFLVGTRDDESLTIWSLN